MLGRRSPQLDMFSAQRMPHQVAPDSFYGQMGSLNRRLFPDDALSDMYSPDNGRPSLPPSLMNGVLLLQFFDDVSDGEAVERTMYDLRWKVALNLPLDFAGFHPTSLTKYRNRLVEHGKERYAFDRFVEAGRQAGFISDKVTLLTDTTDVNGAGAVQDTHTLLRKGIRRLLKEMGYQPSGRRRGLSQETRGLVEAYVDQDRKADIDWADPEARAEHLKALVEDVEAVLDLAVEHADDPNVRAFGWLLTKILGDDVVRDEDGDPQIGKGTARDRIISVTDPEMRHGHKSASRRFDGFKNSVSTDVDSELILDISDVPAPGSDGAHLMPVIGRVETHAGVTVERVIGDGAYGSGDNRAACAGHPGHSIDLVSPVRRPHDPQTHKAAFQIDLEHERATCPQGQTATGKRRKDKEGEEVLKFVFDRSTCEECPLFHRCVRSKRAGRSVTTHRHETLLRAARQRQETEAFKELYRLRGRVEGKIAELVHHGLRNTRYIGEKKRQLQRLWTAAAVNLKRLFTLTQAEKLDAAAIFGALDACHAGLSPG